ncbi:protein C19orf12 homolog [Harmonia axyridis]|uniref:protein C19orf12 homolog n=1 Tax=Harmonia axyridis TaxID=115357 RepID=UPI001E279449|nr:protein C19orf12 homolog [Harmonia axyridis]
MPPSQDQIIDICAVLSEKEQMNVTFKEAGKGFLITGTCAALGTLLGGPIGLFIGGTLGSATAAFHCRGKCRSVVEIITYDMTSDQRRRLADSVTSALQSVTTEDILIILPMILGTDNLRAVVVKEIIKFFSNEMNMTITSS